MNKKFKKPPKIACWLFERLLPKTDKSFLNGDFDEIYNDLYIERGRFIAWVWYWWQVIYTAPEIILNSLRWSLAMFKNYFKTTFRNLKRHKGFSFINISGFVAGLVCSMIILLYVYDECNYDKHYVNSGRIYRLIHFVEGSGGETGSAMSAPTWAPAMKDRFEEIETFCRLSLPSSKIIVSRNDKNIAVQRCAWADEDYFKIFSASFLSGNFETALKEPFSVVISEQMAEIFFGEKNPLGKTLTVDYGLDLKVTGVIKNSTKNSHFKLDLIGSFNTLEKIGKESLHDWFEIEFYSYVLLKKYTSGDELAKKLPEFLNNNVGSVLSSKGINMTLKLQPVSDIHLHSNLEFEIEQNGNIVTVYILSISAVFVLLIACFNFMNLSTARSFHRIKEVGIRKVVGANRGQLIRQFLSESFLITLFAFLISLIFIFLLMPIFNNLTGKNLGMNIHIGSLIFPFILLVLSVGLFSGVYPAFFLSSYRINKIIKGHLKSAGYEKSFRKFLTVLQFSITVMLIAATGIIYKQYDYMLNKDLGFDKNFIVSVPLISNKVRSGGEKIKTELLKIPNVLSVGMAASAPGGVTDDKKLVKSLESDNTGTIVMQRMKVDFDLINTLNFDILSGRNFSKLFSSDRTNSFILNESAVKQLGFEIPEDAVGKSIQVGGSRYGKIIGVVRDFHLKAVSENIEPLVFYMDYGKFLFIRISPQNTGQTVADIKTVWESMFPGHPFEYYFLENSMDSLYTTEKALGKLLGYFSLLSIIIACFGLFGLVSYYLEKKTKEIGIRKVLGASSKTIIRMVTIEFIMLILFSIFIALPLTYFFMNKWLGKFAYHTDLSISVFVFASILTTLIALITIIVQSLKVTNLNPVDSLRSE